MLEDGEFGLDGFGEAGEGRSELGGAGSRCRRRVAKVEFGDGSEEAVEVVEGGGVSEAAVVDGTGVALGEAEEGVAAEEEAGGFAGLFGESGVGAEAGELVMETGSDQFLGSEEDAVHEGAEFGAGVIGPEDGLDDHGNGDAQHGFEGAVEGVLPDLVRGGLAGVEGGEGDDEGGDRAEHEGVGVEGALAHIHGPGAKEEDEDEEEDLVFAEMGHEPEADDGAEDGAEKAGEAAFDGGAEEREVHHHGGDGGPLGLGPVEGEGQADAGQHADGEAEGGKEARGRGGHGKKARADL